MPIEQPAPIVVEPSGEFLGDDGSWSSFKIAAGNQPVNVFVSTEVSSTWVVDPDGCGENDVANCTQARGNFYDSSKSSTWNSKGVFLLGSEVNLGYTAPQNAVNGTYGYDTLGFPGVDSVSVERQVLASIITNKFYVGSLGLSDQPITIADSGDTSPSLITSLKTNNLIPSLSYSYTAGASYGQNGGTNGSLTIGGYDASRFTPNDMSFTFAPNGQRQLVVAIPSITYKDSKGQTDVLKEGILALVDSTVPYMWLPQDACDAFATTFGLVWDPIRSLYTVNDTTHDNLVKANPSVTFTLSNSLTGPTVEITLPYASFDLTATYPLVKNQTKIFPLQRGSDDSQYTLGRFFLQEAFLIVDYERKNFSISQATYDANTPSHIVPITSTNTSSGAGPSGTGAPVVKTTSNGSHGIGTGAIAGIAIAIIVIGALIGGYFLRRRLKGGKTHPKRAELEGDLPKDEESGTRQDADLLADKPKNFSESDGPELENNRSTEVDVKEVGTPLTPPLSIEMDATGTREFYGPDGKRRSRQVMELAGSPVDRSELSSPAPYSRSELATPEPDAIRSELSTPEPMYKDSELPTPEHHAELPSPGMSAASTPGLNPQHPHSALNSPLPRITSHRPASDRFDSSESEAGFTRDGMRPNLFHRRYNSDDSDVPSLTSLGRPPMSARLDSSDSETGLIHPPENRASKASSDVMPLATAPTRPQPTQRDSESDTESLPTVTSASRARVSPTHLDSSSGEDSPGPSKPTAPKHVVALASQFYSSSVSRPTFRRSHFAESLSSRPKSEGIPESDSEPWETSKLESPSTEGQSDVSRYPSLHEGKR